MVYIPVFLVSKVYERGSLKYNEDGFEINYGNSGPGKEFGRLLF
jgi:hypothetical protein